MYLWSHLSTEVRWQCFSSSETLHKKSFPVRVLMLYACRGEYKNTSDNYLQQSNGSGIQLQQWTWLAHFLEVQGVCHLKRTIPQRAPQEYRDYTRSPYYCQYQSLHTLEEPWTLREIIHSPLSTLETVVLKSKSSLKVQLTLHFSSFKWKLTDLEF